MTGRMRVCRPRVRHFIFDFSREDRHPADGAELPGALPGEDLAIDGEQ